MLTRRATLAALAASGLLPAARAEGFPTRPVTIIVPYPPGGPVDLLARLIAQEADLGQPVVVENRPGGSGIIGTNAVAHAEPDGHTLILGTTQTHATNQSLIKSCPYDAVRDFAPVGRVGVTPTLLLVHPSIPATDVKSLIAFIKANPGKYNYGSSGLGSILHLCGEEFKSKAGGLDITHVPYKGSAPMDTDLMGGQIAMAFDATPTAMPLAKSGKLRALGAGMAKRVASMPDLPTLQEQGLPGYECYTWNVFLAPAGTPKPIVDKLNAAINKSLADPAVTSALEKAGIDATPGSTPASTGEFVKAELAKWAPIIKASGAQID